MATEPFQFHPIQLEFVAVRELTIRLKAPPSRTYELPPGGFGYGNSASPLDEETRKFQVGVLATIGDPEFKAEDIPLYLRVELIGGFVASEKSLTSEQVMAWAQRGAPFVLMPYLREQVAALSGRAGFTPILIPLFQIPTASVPLPSEREIAFAKARGYLQAHIHQVMDEVFGTFNFELRGRGGRLEGPHGEISPTTLRGQKLKSYISYRDKSGTDWRLEATIGHTEDWLPVIDLFSDSGLARSIYVQSVDEKDLEGALLECKAYFTEALSREAENKSAKPQV